jgi:hypothetical protein
VRDKPKANSVVTTRLNEGETGKSISFIVKGALGVNEEGKPLDGELVLVLGDVSEKNRERAMLHGFVQKVSDAAAISRNTETGKSATPGEKLSAMRKVVEHFMSGSDEWNMKREGGERGPSAELVLLTAALCEHYPSKSAEALGKWAKARSAQERAALMNEPAIKVIVDRLRVEQAKSVDTGKMLGELEGLGELESEES